MAEENESTTQTQSSGQSDPTWDSLRSAWEEGGLTPGQIMGRLEASRKWEARAKAAPSADELTALREKAERQEALEHELSSDAEKREKEARKTALSEADAKYRPQLTETAFRIAIGDRKTSDEVSRFLAEMNLSAFLNEDGSVDTARVLERAESFAPTSTQQTTTQRSGPSSNGQGNRSGNTRSAAGANGVAAGRDLYAQTHPQKSS